MMERSFSVAALKRMGAEEVPLSLYQVRAYKRSAQQIDVADCTRKCRKRNTCANSSAHSFPKIGKSRIEAGTEKFRMRQMRQIADRKSVV